MAATTNRSAHPSREPTRPIDEQPWAILDQLQANIFVAGPDLVIRYVNPHAAQTLRSIGGEIEAAFRVGVGDIVGGSIHRFHKDPRRVEQILRDPSSMPHAATFAFGHVSLATHINQVVVDGELLGFVVAWENVSELVAARARSEVMLDRLAHTLDNTAALSTMMESLAAASEQMAVTVEDISRSGASAAQSAEGAAAAVRAAETMMTDLSAASRKIDDIAQAIAHVASQTNLLALNATIEAARAGDVGRGFAVVAGEVKQLATQTSDETGRITEMITNIQTLCSQAATAISGIVGVIDSVRETQVTVAAAVEEQAATNREMTRNVAAAAGETREVADRVKAFVDSQR